MVTHADLLRIARRYDTIMAHAMMRALGYQGVSGNHHRHRRRGGGVRRAEDGRRYSGMAWCFANHGSPMDGRRG